MTALTATADRTRFLRLALTLDAVVTGVNGLAYLAAASVLSDLLGPGAGMLRGIGAFLLVYGLAVGLLATRPNRAGVIGVIALNALWAVESVVAVVTGMVEFTTAGAAWAILQALVVAGFAGLQYTGLRRAR
ncbi:hypothetical protein [Thermoactinospora rubra]|uniref:hypothetical protein n=1 Tax=Thermoactinospora rubra TaxID=1088767 RepID=UPI000A0FE62E|nr:hypothetical protein [Thermoactinospora rubra]